MADDNIATRATPGGRACPAADDEANRAIRGLAGCTTLHIRHYGHRRRSDVHRQHPTP